MDANIILKLIELLLIPISIGVVGAIISSKIENKNNWATKWSENFFQLFQEFNTAVEDLIHLLFHFSELCKQKQPSQEQEKEFLEKIRKIGLDISRKEFGIRIQLCFAPKTQKEFIALSEKLREQINYILQNKKGSTDKIQSILINLNKKAKIAHGEILGLKK